MPSRDRTFKVQDLFRIYDRHLDRNEQIELLHFFLGSWLTLMRQILEEGGFSKQRAVLQALLGDLLVLRYTGDDLRDMVDAYTEVFLDLQVLPEELFTRTFTRKQRRELNRALSRANPLSR